MRCNIAGNRNQYIGKEIKVMFENADKEIPNISAL